MFEISGPIFEQNVTINFDPIFEQNANFDPVFEQNANFDPIFEKSVYFAHIFEKKSISNILSMANEVTIKLDCF